MKSSPWLRQSTRPSFPVSFPFRLNCLTVPGHSGDALSGGGLAHSSQSLVSMGSHSMLSLSGYPNWQHHFEIQPFFFFFCIYSSFIPVLPSVISRQRHSITGYLLADICSVSIWRCYTVLEVYVAVLGWRGISFPAGQMVKGFLGPWVWGFKNHATLSQNGCTILHPHQQWVRAPISAHLFTNTCCSLSFLFTLKII